MADVAKKPVGGLILGLAITLVVVGWITMSIHEPDRKAARAWDAIKPGMTVEQVEGLPRGRSYVHYRVGVTGDWSTVSRDAFLAAQAQTNQPVERRLSLTYMGTAPRRVTVDVEVDAAGKVSGVLSPRVWD